MIILQTYEIIDEIKYYDLKKKFPNLDNYIGRGEKMFFTDAQEYIKELRNCERNF